jgi:hypothetical protein
VDSEVANRSDDVLAVLAVWNSGAAAPTAAEYANG